MNGIATATEVSTIAVLNAVLAGRYLNGGIKLKKLYAMLLEMAHFCGAVLVILGIV